MRQKVALTAAHLLCEGKVADMGTGSGSASLAFAQLYPRLQVIGVDVSPTMVELARARHQLPNLTFALGDAAKLVFEAGSLDGILASSMLHHVTSFTDYDHSAARRALEAQAAQLRVHGVLVVRDFVDPGPEEILLDLPCDDGDESSHPERCSSARLFERFSTEFRRLSPSPGFALRTGDPSSTAVTPGFKRFRTSHKLAAEFLLRKDYRADWDSEIKEEYTYFTQPQFEAAFRGLGLRVLTSTPVYNPWIVKNRFEGKARLLTLAGDTLPFPATNYLIVGERVAPEEGVDFAASPPLEPLGFLALEHYRDTQTHGMRDLVRRPNTTLDVLPWFEEQGRVYVLARTSYPRPLLCAEPERARPLDGSRACPWSVEPLSFLQRDKPVGQTIEDALWDYARLDAASLIEFDDGLVYYPSPGGVAERVESTFVQIKPSFVQAAVGARSGFSTSGRVQAIEAEQLLRAAQVGGLSDARLELNVYELLRRTGLSFGPWIGESIVLSEAAGPAHVADAAALLTRKKRRRFAPASAGAKRFLSVTCREFEERNSEGKTVARQKLEYVMPLPFTAVTASIILLRKHAGTVFVGLDDDDLPAAQSFEGNSALLVTPAFRLPDAVDGISQARSYLRERLLAEHGVRLGEIAPLGGKYYPSPGATPEVVHPFYAEITEEAPAAHPLIWTPLRELLNEPRLLREGHLRIAAFRAAHAVQERAAQT